MKLNGRCVMIIINSYTQVDNMSDLIVTIKQGDLKGKIDKDQNDQDYYTFHAIPYAKPPLGALRFKAPQPPESWNGLRDATEEGNECFSRHPLYQKKSVGSEDCLILNVFTPELPTKKKHLKPVMMWIHGGGFKVGSSKLEMHSPEFLMTGDVVLVTVNFRLGIFGFLSFEDTTLRVPGNAGLKDLVMALRWIKENIESFNGDPNNVTIFGESSGGALVHYLVLSPMANGLFHKAICQSGVAVNIWAKGTRCRQEYMRHLGYENCKSEREMLDILQKADKKDLLDAHWKIPDLIEAHAGAHRVFGPVVENLSPYEEAFLSDEPINILKSGKFNKVPMIFGYTSSEGLMFTLFKEPMITDFETIVPYTLKFPRGSSMSKVVAEKIKQFYFGDDEPSDNKQNYHDVN
ncbi:PREDICTED: putative inactive carboxylesterase 4 [Nicrophorus vespilloides]|uniref:Inactive carboxylesterase 4 n=1 Tax=Nicrophorus vespilloides TaxID=110193 RepID=A0ABM1NB19_NICVS|nr:PREDICTED: putative inactive carboxylesterase 4 [Nicrophorus vespilloides]